MSRSSLAAAVALACCAAMACDGGSSDGTASPDSADVTADLAADTAADSAAQADAELGPQPDASPAAPYARCEPSERTGGFVVALGEKSTSVQGGAASGVVPADVPAVTLDQGECRLLRPPTLFCDPACPSGQACTPSGACIAYPTKVDIGTVTISGLSAPVEMKAILPTRIYYFAGDLPHPGFAAGDPIGLSVVGPETVSLAATGVPALVVETTALAIARDQPGALKWTAPADPSAARVRIELSIANHGGTPGRVECLTADDGSFEIPTAHINALLDLGYSGFPSVSLSRHTADSTQLATGCFDLVVESGRTLAVEIPGLTSCSNDDDCEAGQTCGVDLTCGVTR
ncbi:MAG: hypothetical protein R3F39_09060 [Myxococcota bacterium]